MCLDCAGILVYTRHHTKRQAVSLMRQANRAISYTYTAVYHQRFQLLSRFTIFLHMRLTTARQRDMLYTGQERRR